MAAAYAYRGHWSSLKPSSEKDRIRQIEEEEWDHRRRVGEWLTTLDAGPRPWIDKVLRTIGRALGLLCHISGSFMPMYFAGRLESQDSVEDDDAAALARELELHECVEDLLDMARVELEHEVFFRAVVSGHRLMPVMKKLFGWS